MIGNDLAVRHSFLRPSLKDERPLPQRLQKYGQ
jgi:hypothetical protein